MTAQQLSSLLTERVATPATAEARDPSLCRQGRARTFPDSPTTAVDALEKAAAIDSDHTFQYTLGLAYGRARQHELAIAASWNSGCNRRSNGPRGFLEPAVNVPKMVVEQPLG